MPNGLWDLWDIPSLITGTWHSMISKGKALLERSAFTSRDG